MVIFSPSLLNTCFKWSCSKFKASLYSVRNPLDDIFILCTQIDAELLGIIFFQFNFQLENFTTGRYLYNANSISITYLSFSLSLIWFLNLPSKPQNAVIQSNCTSQSRALKVSLTAFWKLCSSTVLSNDARFIAFVSLMNSFLEILSHSCTLLL